jgi:Holliday junction resolvase RusA-like endonuclease
VLDGLTEGGAWRDDGQVVFLQAVKFYGQPGCRITVERTDG